MANPYWGLVYCWAEVSQTLQLRCPLGMVETRTWRCWVKKLSSYSKWVMFIHVHSLSSLSMAYCVPSFTMGIGWIWGLQRSLDLGGSLHWAAHSGEPLQWLPADPSRLLVAGGSHSSNGATFRTGSTGGRSAGSNLVDWWLLGGTSHESLVRLVTGVITCYNRL